MGYVLKLNLRVIVASARLSHPTVVETLFHKSAYSPVVHTVVLQYAVSNIYRFHDHWRNTLQRLVFLTSLTNYLMTGKLLSRAELSERLGSELLVEHVT